MMIRKELKNVRLYKRYVSSLSIKSINIRHPRRVHVAWQDGSESTFDACWLKDNCMCPKCAASTGQKFPRAFDFKSIKVNGAEIVKDENVRINWTTSSTDKCVSSQYSSKWLKTYAYSSIGTKDTKTCGSMSKESNNVPEIDYQNLVQNGDAALFDWMEKINNFGLCIIRNTPKEELTVKAIANRIGPSSHTIYGETFHVRVDRNPINIAYTDVALAPHMDLAYYESPPGIQMLHCLEFEDGVKGGESTFIDNLALAEILKARHPEAFETLKLVPATFQKDHIDRENPVKMFYQRPHIHTNYLNEVTAVFWSPPFEGPLRVAPDLVEKYYDAYKHFEDLLEDETIWKQHGYVFRLRPGDLITFNNRRMLHGRHAFTSQDGVRHLEGCYLDADNFLNVYRVLANKLGKPDGALGPSNETRFGNTSHR